jgi:hypothetical protein
MKQYLKELAKAVVETKDDDEILKAIEDKNRPLPGMYYNIV